MKNKQIIQLISSSILLILWVSINQFFLENLNTTLVWIIGFIVYIGFLKGIKFKNSKNKYYVVLIYLVWIAVSCVYGIFQSQSYWDYKGLIMNAFSLFLPVTIYALSNIGIMQKIIRNYIKFAIPFFFVFALFVPNNIYGYYLATLTLLLLFFPLLNLKYKIMMGLIVFMVFMSSLGARTTIISFGFSVLLVILYYLRFLHEKWLFNSLRLLLLLLPFVLFGLAIAGVFNIFKIEETSGTELTAEISTTGEKENLLADTRTFLYKEVLLSAFKHNYWLYGRSPARGNDTVSFSEVDMVENRSERLRNEVGVLNIFTWTGVIGVCLYFFIFVKATYLAINKSRNTISRLLGLYVAYRWFNSWIAEVSNFDLINFTIWMAVAMCFSESFRSMTNQEIKIWVKGISNYRYNILLNKNKIK